MQCRRNYDVVGNAIFTVSELKKADNIADYNFNKLKHAFIVLVCNIKKSNVQLLEYRYPTSPNYRCHFTV